jgi:hypothetical protein
MVAPRGRTDDETVFFTPKLVSTHCSVTGSVAELEDVE